MQECICNTDNLTCQQFIKIIMSKQREKFLIPDLNIVSNPTQLKVLQQKLLSKHYETQSQQKTQRSQLEKKTYRQFHNPQAKHQVKTNPQEGAYVLYDQSIKTELAMSYQQEIQRKQAYKRDEKVRRVHEQQSLTRKIQEQVMVDKERAKKMSEVFKRDALDLVKERERRKTQQKYKQLQEKQQYQMRCQDNSASVNKLKTFRQHYRNVDKVHEAQKLSYLAHVAPQNKVQLDKKELYVEKSIKQHQQKMWRTIQKQSEAAMRFKQDLKTSLVSQIKEKQHKKLQQLNATKQIGYTSQAYLQMHHPINNPIDFRICHDNKYLLKELSSGLARSGSQSLIS